MIQLRVNGCPAEFAIVDGVMADLVEADAAWLTADQRMAVRLGLHELLVNVARHALLDCGGDIDIEILGTPSSLAINVTDGGIPWAASLSGKMPEEPATSGYGIPIILAAFDDARYCRSVQRNHWSLRIYRGHGASRPA